MGCRRVKTTMAVRFLREEYARCVFLKKCKKNGDFHGLNVAVRVGKIDKGRQQKTTEKSVVFVIL